VARFPWNLDRRRGLGLLALAVLLLAVAGLLPEPGPDRNTAADFLQPVRDGADAPPAGLVHELPAGPLYVQAGRLSLGTRDIGICPRLVGVVEQDGRVLAVCSDRLWLLSPEGEVLGQADSGRGVPEGLSAVTREQDRVLLRNRERSFAVDLGDLSVRPVAPGAGGGAEAEDSGGWAQAFSDMGRGPLTKRRGIWLIGVVALFIAVLALSALALARRRRRHA
jgi:hypothetical protein